MKRVLSLFLLAALVFSLCACGQGQAETVVNTAPTTEAPQESTAAN